MLPGEPLAETQINYQTLGEQEEQVASIEANDLGVAPSAIMEVGRKNLDTQPTKGRFPTGLSVVRVDAATRGDEPEHFLRISQVEEYLNAYLFQAMQDLAMLREVIMLTTYGLDPRGADWRSVLESSVRNDCGLCLMYAEIYETSADAELVGVLWDARNEMALATYRAPVMVPLDTRLRYEKKKKYVGLKPEAEKLAMTELQRLVRETIWDVAARDSASATTQPDPWQIDQPLYPREFYRYRRILLEERPQR